MTHTLAKGQGHYSKDRVETAGRTDRRTEPTGLPSMLTRSVTNELRNVRVER